MGFSLGQYKEDMYSPEGLLIHKKGDPYIVEPGEDHQVHVYAKSSAFKPYLGFGYGVLFWGAPDLYTHDGTNLTKDIENIKGKVGDYVDFIGGLKVYPSISVRFTKTLF